MPAISIGVGGWAYFPGNPRNKLAACANLYDFVEVNSTFYKLPPEKLASKWRAMVPDEFQFSVRASRKLTHENHLEPTTENFKEYERNLAICKILRAFVLHFQFPPSFDVSRQVFRNWRDFFASVGKVNGLNFAIEARNERVVNDPAFQSFLSSYDIIPTGDPSRGEIFASSESKIAYSRIFGPGEHTKWIFSSVELENVKEEVLKIPATRRYVTFHNITMYEDGARMKQMVKKGDDPTPAVMGIDSLRDAIISARVKYPVSAGELISELGWRTVNMLDGRRVHVKEVLKTLPGEIQFDSLDEILDRTQAIFQGPDPGQRN